MGKILIVYGGNSTEHDVSIITALQIYKNYAKGNDDVELVYISRSDGWLVGEELQSFAFYKKKDFSKLKKVSLLPAGNNVLYEIKKSKKLKPLFDVKFVVNCCHGSDGENGNLQGLFEMCKIPSSTGGVLSLAICMDKVLTKDILQAKEIPFVDYFVVSKRDWLGDRNVVSCQIEQFGYPVVVKPCSQGSSVGVCLVESFDEFQKAVNFAMTFGDRVVVERAIENKREFNCCVKRVNGEIVASKIEEPVCDSTVISFNDKYLGGASVNAVKGGIKASGVRTLGGMAGAERNFPAKIDVKLERRIVRLAKRFYGGVELNGVVRIDFIYDNDSEKLYLCEANAIPGSLGYYFWGDVNLFDEIVENGLKYWKVKFGKNDCESGANIF